MSGQDTGQDYDLRTVTGEADTDGMRMLIIALSLLWMTGCVEQSLVLGHPGPRLGTEEVDIYYVERPGCNFETVALIRVTGGYVTLGSMIRKMRGEAAEIGATGLYVLETRQLENREFIGTAKAIRCLSA